jgi:hypothetical protein
MAFSADAKFMVTQTNGPDWMLHFWSWEKAKILACVKTTNAPDKSVQPLSSPGKEGLIRDPHVGQVIHQWYSLH